MLTFTRFLLVIVILTMATACKKEVEKIVVQQVDKVYSWTEVKQPVGTSRCILNMYQDADQLYLQTPFYLGVLSPLRKGHYYQQYAAGFPTDVNLRTAMSGLFTAYPLRDTVVYVLQTQELRKREWQLAFYCSAPTRSQGYPGDDV